MLEAAGITLRDSIEAILVIFVMMAYLKRTGQETRKKFIYVGTVLAVGISIGLAVVLSKIGIDPENELVEGILYFTAALLVGSLTVWMVKHAKNFKADIEAKMEKSTSGLMLGFIAFIMVLREGAEIVIFMQSLLLTGNTPVQNFLGGMIGVLLSVIFGFVFLWGTTKINMNRFFKVTSVILGILVIQLTANGLHELFEVGILPSTQGLMWAVGFLAKDSTGTFIIALMLFSLILLVLYDLFKTRLPDLSGLKPVDRRKRKYRFFKEKYAKIALSGLVIFLSIPLFSASISSSDVLLPEPKPVEAENGQVTITVPEENGIHKYQIGEVRVLVVQKDNQTSMALDRCYICPPTGYGYDGERLICQTCSAPIAPSTIGHAGGCNPKVLDYEIDSGTISVSTDQLSSTWGH